MLWLVAFPKELATAGRPPTQGVKQYLIISTQHTMTSNGESYISSKTITLVCLCMRIQYITWFLYFLLSTNYVSSSAMLSYSVHVIVFFASMQWDKLGGLHFSPWHHCYFTSNDPWEGSCVICSICCSLHVSSCNLRVDCQMGTPVPLVSVGVGTDVGHGSLKQTAIEWD